MLVAGVLSAAVPAIATELTHGRSPANGMGPIELQMLRNIQRRENNMAEQQRLRELDRRSFGAPMQRPDVPVMKRNCQTQVFGSRFLSTCR